eukprot:1850672-Rhodomonas_salina.5
MKRQLRGLDERGERGEDLVEEEERKQHIDTHDRIRQLSPCHRARESCAGDLVHSNVWNVTIGSCNYFRSASPRNCPSTCHASSMFGYVRPSTSAKLQLTGMRCSVWDRLS